MGILPEISVKFLDQKSTTHDQSNDSVKIPRLPPTPPAPIVGPPSQCPLPNVRLRFWSGEWYRSSMGGCASHVLGGWRVSSSLTFQVASTQTIPKACIGLWKKLCVTPCWSRQFQMARFGVLEIYIYMGSG